MVIKPPVFTHKERKINYTFDPMTTFMDMNKRLMINALEKTLGVVTSACKIVGIARSTHYNWYDNDIDYRDAVDDISNIALDFAESKLH